MIPSFPPKFQDLRWDPLTSTFNQRLFSMVLWYGSHFLVIFPDFQILALVAPASRSWSRKTWLWWRRIASFASEAVAHRIWSGPQTTAGPRKTKRRREWNFFGPQKARTGRNTARVSRGIEAENGDAQSHKFVDGCFFVRRLIYSACLPEGRAKEKSSISIGKTWNIWNTFRKWRISIAILFVKGTFACEAQWHAKKREDQTKLVQFDSNIKITVMKW